MLAPTKASDATAALRADAVPVSTGSGLARSGVTWIALFTRSAHQERRVRSSTLEAYALDLASLTRWAAVQGLDVLDLTTADLTRYVVERSAQGKQLTTLARHMSTFRLFYAFVVSHAVLEVNPGAAVLLPRAPRPGPRPVRDDVLRRVLRPPLRHAPSVAAAYRAQRDHTIVRMLYGTRLGISDVRLLCWRQIDEQCGIVRVSRPKCAVRTFVLDAPLLDALKGLREGSAWADCVPDETAYCFPTTSGLPMSRQAFCQIVRKWGDESGYVEPVTPSALRHAGRDHR